MTLPYIWYRSPVWIVLCRAVNSFRGFLRIFWKVPVIVAQAPLAVPNWIYLYTNPYLVSPFLHKGFFFFNFTDE